MSEIQQTHINAFTGAVQEEIKNARAAITALEDASTRLTDRLASEVTDNKQDEAKQETVTGVEEEKPQHKDNKGAHQQNNSTGKTGAGAFDNTATKQFVVIDGLTPPEGVFSCVVIYRHKQ